MYPDHTKVDDLLHGFALYRHQQTDRLEVFPTGWGWDRVTYGPKGDEGRRLTVFKGGEDLHIFLVGEEDVRHLHTDFWQVMLDHAADSPHTSTIWEAGDGE